MDKSREFFFFFDEGLTKGPSYIDTALNLFDKCLLNIYCVLSIVLYIVEKKQFPLSRSYILVS